MSDLVLKRAGRTEISIGTCWCTC